MSFIQKFIVTNKFIRYSPFYWWIRLISHPGFRFNNYYVQKEFWSSLNSEWEHMEYVHKFEEFWGPGTYPPETMILSERDFDSLVERLNQKPKFDQRVYDLMSKKSPWDEQND